VVTQITNSSYSTSVYNAFAKADPVRISLRYWYDNEDVENPFDDTLAVSAQFTS